MNGRSVGGRTSCRVRPSTGDDSRPTLTLRRPGSGHFGHSQLVDSRTTDPELKVEIEVVAVRPAAKG